MTRDLEMVQVTWVDACDTLTTWTSIEDIDDNDLTPSECVSTGFLYRMTTTELVIVQSQDLTQSNITQGIIIPRSSVTRLEPLTPSHTEKMHT